MGGLGLSLPEWSAGRTGHAVGDRSGRRPSVPPIGSWNVKQRWQPIESRHGCESRCLIPDSRGFERLFELRDEQLIRSARYRNGV